jgi:hypothetical protein
MKIGPGSRPVSMSVLRKSHSLEGSIHIGFLVLLLKIETTLQKHTPVAV